MQCCLYEEPENDDERYLSEFGIQSSVVFIKRMSRWIDSTSKWVEMGYRLLMNGGMVEDVGEKRCFFCFYNFKYVNIAIGEDVSKVTDCFPTELPPGRARDTRLVIPSDNDNVLGSLFLSFASRSALIDFVTEYRKVMELENVELPFLRTVDYMISDVKEVKTSDEGTDTGFGETPSIIMTQPTASKLEWMHFSAYPAEPTIHAVVKRPDKPKALQYTPIMFKSNQSMMLPFPIIYQSHHSKSNFNSTSVIVKPSQAAVEAKSEKVNTSCMSADNSEISTESMESTVKRVHFMPESNRSSCLSTLNWTESDQSSTDQNDAVDPTNVATQLTVSSNRTLAKAKSEMLQHAPMIVRLGRTMHRVRTVQRAIDNMTKIE